MEDTPPTCEVIDLAPKPAPPSPAPPTPAAVAPTDAEAPVYTSPIDYPRELAYVESMLHQREDIKRRYNTVLAAHGGKAGIDKTLKSIENEYRVVEQRIAVYCNVINRLRGTEGRN